MTDRERRLGRSGVMRHNMGMPAVKLQPVSQPGKNEVLRWLRLVEDDPWYRVNPVPLFSPCFLALMGRSEGGKTQLYAARDGRPGAGGSGIGKHVSIIAASLAAQVAVLMQEIAEGKLVFTASPWTAWRLTPPDILPHPQPMLVLREDYRWWARCRACHGRRFAPVAINGRENAACWDCIPPRIYGSIAAKPSRHSLIPDAIERWHGSCATGPAAM